MKAMPDARKAKVSAIRANAVVEHEVTAIHTNLDAIPEKSHDCVTRHD
jgi:hypothetical protein